MSQPLQRKKSLPDVQALPRATDAMSREEVSSLGSARREELRRMADESERLRANPLLYLVSPQVKVNIVVDDQNGKATSVGMGRIGSFVPCPRIRLTQ